MVFSLWPLVARITQQYASSPNSIQPNGHTGIDFGVPVGTPVKAIGAGTVVWADWAHKLSASNKWLIAPAYAGICVLIDHGNGYISVYAHLNETALNIGNRVAAGQVIGKSGNTGLSSGPHLHFEIIKWPLNPDNGFYGRINPNSVISTVVPAFSVTLKANQRKVGPTKVNMRSAPNTKAKILREIQPNTIETFTGYVLGERVNGMNLWYKDAQGYAWCGGFTAQTVTGLPNVTPKPVTPPPAPAPAPKPVPVPVPTPEPANPSYYSFTKDFDFVEYKPAHLTNVQRAVDYPGVVVFPPKPTHAVIHQFDAKAKNPSIDGVINHFATERPGSESSAHFSVAGNRIVQHVSLKDRAYHAGKVGNDFIGIETDPQQDAATVASVKKLLVALKAKYGYELVKILHKNVVGNSTNCGAEINLADYELTPPVVVPVPVPEPEPTPAPEPAPTRSEEEVIDNFLAFLKESYFQKK